MRPGKNSPSNNQVSRRDVLRASGVASIAALSGVAETTRSLRIDVHAHVWTDDYLDLVQSFGKKDTGVQRGKGAGPNDAEMEKRFAQMDASKVSMQILSICPQAPHFEDKAHAVAAARKANDMYAETVRRWPKRFRAFAALPLPHVDESLKELDRALGQLGMIGATITTSIVGRSPADPAFLPVYEELNRRNSVLFIHPCGCNAYSPLIADYHLTWMIGAPIEDTISVLHLIERGIPMRFPKLKIINSHLGGALPMVYQRLDNQYTWENPTIPERPTLSARRMWYDTVGHGHIPAIRAAVETLGADRLVLGTDFPYEAGPLYKRAIDYIELAGFKPQETARILDQNAASLLNIGPS